MLRPFGTCVQKKPKTPPGLKDGFWDPRSFVSLLLLYADRPVVFPLPWVADDSSLRFLYDGNRINDDDTPASLEMEDNGGLPYPPPPLVLVTSY